MSNRKNANFREHIVKTVLLYTGLAGILGFVIAMLFVRIPSEHLQGSNFFFNGQNLNAQNPIDNALFGIGTSSTGMSASSTGISTAPAGMMTSSTGLNTGTPSISTDSTGLNTDSTGTSTGIPSINTGSTGLNTDSTGTSTGTPAQQTQCTLETCDIDAFMVFGHLDSTSTRSETNPQTSSVYSMKSDGSIQPYNGRNGLLNDLSSVNPTLRRFGDLHSTRTGRNVLFLNALDDSNQLESVYMNPFGTRMTALFNATRFVLSSNATLQGALMLIDPQRYIEDPEQSFLNYYENALAYFSNVLSISSIPTVFNVIQNDPNNPDDYKEALQQHFAARQYQVATVSSANDEPTASEVFAAFDTARQLPAFAKSIQPAFYRDGINYDSFANEDMRVCRDNPAGYPRSTYNGQSTDGTGVPNNYVADLVRSDPIFNQGFTLGIPQGSSADYQPYCELGNYAGYQGGTTANELIGESFTIDFLIQKRNSSLPFQGGYLVAQGTNPNDQSDFIRIFMDETQLRFQIQTTNNFQNYFPQEMVYNYGENVVPLPIPDFGFGQITVGYDRSERIGRIWVNSQLVRTNSMPDRQYSRDIHFYKDTYENLNNLQNVNVARINVFDRSLTNEEVKQLRRIQSWGNRFSGTTAY